MQQHREVEHHREREPGDVLQRAEAGLRLLDARGDAGPRSGRRRRTRRARRARRPAPSSRSGRCPVAAARGGDAGSDTPPTLRCRSLSVRRPTLGSMSAVESPVDGSTGSLSPSRAADFLSCPLMFRFRTVDRLPEPPSPDALRGTLVHKVLEDIFDLPAAERTREQAQAHAPRPPGTRSGRASRGRRRSWTGLDVEAWLASRQESRRPLLRARGPDPARAGRARGVRRVPARLRAAAARGRSTGSTSRRTARSGWWTTRPGDSPGRGLRGPGAVPAEVLRLMIWRTRGVVPSVLQLIYLGDSQVVCYEPDEADLLATERKVAGDLGGDPGGARDRATTSRAPAAAATGAPTTPCARPSAARRRRSRRGGRAPPRHRAGSASGPGSDAGRSSDADG